MTNDYIFVGVHRYPTEIYYLDTLTDCELVKNTKQNLCFNSNSAIQLARKIDKCQHNPAGAPLGMKLT